MKNTFKKSVALLAFVAVFAMIFTGCKKDDSSSSSGGGGNIPTGDYGTVTVAGTSYNIAVAGYEAYYDEDLQEYLLTIVMADRTNYQTANMVEFVIVGAQSLPSSGTYNIISQDPMPVGSCGGMFMSPQSGKLICTSGTLTISGTSSDYHIQSSGQATPMGGGTAMAFTVNFEGPLVQGK